MTHSRRYALAAPLLALSVALLASAGSAGAQSTPPQSAAATVDKPTTADADKAARDAAAAKAEADRKAEARKPKRDAKADRKSPEREIEEEEAP